MTIQAKYDYISPGLLSRPDAEDHFPDMVAGDAAGVLWKWMRKNDPHIWRCDRSMPMAGFINRDETAILYNTALRFAGKRALEIGCLFGWSTWHIAAAGCALTVIDPLLRNEGVCGKVMTSLSRFSADIEYQAQSSPQALFHVKQPWDFIFIDANHDAPHPMIDTVAAEHYASADALILFHDVLCPDVYEAVEYLAWRGWGTRIYYTSQMMAAAFRGTARPIRHDPDPAIRGLPLPPHLSFTGMLSEEEAVF